MRVAVYLVECAVPADVLDHGGRDAVDHVLLQGLEDAMALFFGPRCDDNLPPGQGGYWPRISYRALLGRPSWCIVLPVLEQAVENVRSDEPRAACEMSAICCC